MYNQKKSKMNPAYSFLGLGGELCRHLASSKCSLLPFSVTGPFPPLPGNPSPNFSVNHFFALLYTCVTHVCAPQDSFLSFDSK